MKNVPRAFNLDEIYMKMMEWFPVHKGWAMSTDTETEPAFKSTDGLVSSQPVLYLTVKVEKRFHSAYIFMIQILPHRIVMKRQTAVGYPEVNSKFTNEELEFFDRLDFSLTPEQMEWSGQDIGDWV